MRIPYIRVSKGLPTEAVQRAALAAAGLTEGELAEAYVDRGRPRRGEPPQPQRDYIVGAVRGGDELWVARAGVLSTTLDDALAFVAKVCDQGATLRIASTGQAYNCPSSVAPQISDGLRLAAAIREDERKSALAVTRAGLKSRPAGKPRTDPKKLAAAEKHWFNPDIDGDEAARRAGISRRVLHREFGPRNTPRFGRKTP